jgi:sulfonate transport system substrate-binding protein
MTSAKRFGRMLLPAVIITAVCAGPPTGLRTSAAAERLRIGINLTTIETLPIYLAAEGPAGGGMELTGGAIPALTSGQVDAATNAETQAVLRSAADPEIRVILTVAEYSYRIVARRSAGVRTISDLRGKRIATALNSSAHFYLVKTLQDVRLSEADIAVVGMPPSEMPAALARGAVDAVSIWEPAAGSSVQALGPDAVILRGPRYRERFNLNTTRAVAAEPRKRAALVEILRSVMRASREVEDHPARAQALIAGKLNVAASVVSSTWGLFSFPASIPGDLLESMVEQETWLAKNQNRAARPREAIGALIDASLWPEAAAR